MSTQIDWGGMDRVIPGPGSDLRGRLRRERNGVGWSQRRGIDMWYGGPYIPILGVAV